MSAIDMLNSIIADVSGEEFCMHDLANKLSDFASCRRESSKRFGKTGIVNLVQCTILVLNEIFDGNQVDNGDDILEALSDAFATITPLEILRAKDDQILPMFKEVLDSIPNWTMFTTDTLFDNFMPPSNDIRQFVYLQNIVQYTFHLSHIIHEEWEFNFVDYLVLEEDSFPAELLRKNNSLSPSALRNIGIV